MTEEEYYEKVRVLGLRKTQFQETYITINGEPFSVPLAKHLQPEQRIAIIDRIRNQLGIDRKD